MGIKLINQTFLCIHANMPKQRSHKDIHLRLSENDLKAIAVLAAREKTTRTEIIRRAIAAYVYMSERERSAFYESVLVKQIKFLQEQLSGWLGMLWRASAESMYLSFEVYRRTSAREIKEDELNELKKDAKKFASQWVTQTRSSNLVDRLEITAVEPFQLEIALWTVDPNAPNDSSP
jgi:hypothetical protein